MLVKMWAKIITIKRTKDLKYFSLCAFNLFNTRVSQFELNYWNKWTFSQHLNLLRCTCFYMNYRFVKSLSHFKRNNIICKQIATRWLFCNKVDTVLLITVYLLVKKWLVQERREWPRYWRKWRKGKVQFKREHLIIFHGPRIKTYVTIIQIG